MDIAAETKARRPQRLIVGLICRSVGQHWPEYLMEAAELGLFMVSACVFGIVLFSPESPLVHLVHSSEIRRALMGLAMGLTAIALVYSPWGQQSGAHLNPAVTLTFLRLGKIHWTDAMFYSLFQSAGGIAGVALFALVFPESLSTPEVDFVVTVPGSRGPLIAWLVEFAISFGLMLVVLVASNHPRHSRLTGVFVGCVLAAFIFWTAPLSGTSLNPARTLASAIPSGNWTGFWVYVTAPPLGMLAAAECSLVAGSHRRAYCAKLHHANNRRCVFCQERVPAPLKAG